MMLALLVSQALAGAMPTLDAASACQADQTCLVREENARARLEQSWGDHTLAARAHCVARVETGHIDQYAGLEACLIIYRVTGEQGTGMPPPAREARIDLRPVSLERN